jgi:nucleotide-binding universal stress UspA family protein
MVLICYDGSPTAKRAIPAAHAILGDKQATVLHVWRAPNEFVEPDWFGGVSTSVGPPIAQLEALALERAARVTYEGTELARAAGFTAEPRTQPSVGRIWQTILEVARELEAEVIVVGERGHSPVQSVLLGSVSNSVVHHAHRPVLVIPRADANHNSRGAP